MLYVFDCDGVLVDSEIIASHRRCRSCWPNSATRSRRQEVTVRFAGLTSVAIGDVVEAETGRKLPDDFFETRQGRDRPAAGARPQGGARRPRDARPAGRAADLRVLQFIDGAAEAVAGEDAPVGPLRCRTSISAVEVGDLQAEAGAQRLSLRHGAVRHRSARYRGAGGFGVRRDGGQGRRRAGDRLHRRRPYLARAMPTC